MSVQPATKPTASQRVFHADLDRFNRAFAECGAVVNYPDGTFIDPSKAPEHLVSAYRALLSYGYATGLLPTDEEDVS